MFCAVFYPDALTKDALRFYRAYTQPAPDELSSFAVSGTIPAHETFPQLVHGTPFILFAACYAGSIEEGARVMLPLRNGVLLWSIWVGQPRTWPRNPSLMWITRMEGCSISGNRSLRGAAVLMAGRRWGIQSFGICGLSSVALYQRFVFAP